MNSEYLGLIPFSMALELEQQAWQRVHASQVGVVLGFESEPVITLGVRGDEQDILWSAAELSRRNFSVQRLERGGQATLHHPGQLVIFPIFPLQEFGARLWIEFLLKVTRQTLAASGKEVRCRPEQPGLFSDAGKVVSVGVRIKQGISTHGLSINVSNDLEDFRAIRACGVQNAAMDRIGSSSPELIFSAWLRNFELGLTSSRNLMNLECSTSDVRL